MHSIYQLCFLLLGTIVPTFVALHAQQLPQYTQFSLNPFLVNPALAGTEDFIDLRAGYRSQWSGFKDAPQTAYFSAHSSLNPVRRGYGKQAATASRTAVGMTLSHDKTGPLKQSNGSLTFAYNFALNRHGLRASFGLNGGIKGFSFNPEGYTDHVLDPDDPTIQQSVGKVLLDLGAGVWLYNEEFFAGASSSQLFNPDYEAGGTAGEFAPETALLRHYFVMAGVKLKLGYEAFLVPSVLVKQVAGAPISYELNAKVMLQDRYWLGGNYRHEDSFAVFGGLLLNDRVSVSYSFDLVLSKIRTAAAGSNEIHVGYRIFSEGVVCPNRFW
ncbi:PorP/SprF family type IX secretion system membrane protein [Neolewinella persica]|uniref:PorP/SprF family type IX secretion system membrane protein n=1 Tax=Neolewinella persica TaxID=70998 RepID=UPI0003649921|nr:type IX secretion system membrane protein PorP/SprF [Neolewinella persica]